VALVAVVGAGAWGTALALHAARLDHRVRLWAHEHAVADAIERSHENPVYLPGILLPSAVRASSDAEEVVRGADLVVLVPPSTHLRAVARTIEPFVAPRALVVVATKGIEEGSLARMPDVVAEALPRVAPERVVVLSGPSFAKEVARGLPTDVVVASKSPDAARAAQLALHAPILRVYTSADPVGVAIGGAVKNVVAIAAGACDGLGLGTNARAALVTRGLAEITRLGMALGADPFTFLGLAGVGDLVLTCTGDLSRNRTLGRKIAEGCDPQRYLAAQRQVAEGFTTSAAAWALAQRRSVDMPITEQVFAVLHEGRPLLEAIRLLVTRAETHELVGIR
jgi:glycerol-3-phosphate dehydrogenase (NAD(P)+)